MPFVKRFGVVVILCLLSVLSFLHNFRFLSPHDKNVLTCPNKEHVIVKHTDDVTLPKIRDHRAYARDTTLWDSPYSNVQSVSCPRLLQNDSQEQARAEILQDAGRRCQYNVQNYLDRTDNCTQYVRSNIFTTASVSPEEAAFPLAFSILVYKDPDQVERLLRAIYRPHNVYCIHVDQKSSPVFRYKVALVARCLPNVFLSNVSVDVQWGRFTNLEPELLCMRQLLDHAVRWRYFINLTGQEFPLKTNKQLVKILTALKGANYISREDAEPNLSRWEAYLPAPFDLTIIKGPVHVAVVRDFVHYVVHSNVARAFLDWLRQTRHPDESFFSTLNYNTRLGAPGSVSVVPDHQDKFPLRYKAWTYEDIPCAGTYVRHICNYGVGDLPRLTSSPAMFANKLSYDLHPLAYDCLEEWLAYNVLREERGQTLELNMTAYNDLWIVRHRYTGPVKMW